MTPYLDHCGVQLYVGDVREVLRELPDESVNCCVTSPPYWGLRDYGCDGQIGLEPTPDAYVAEMVSVFREVRRVLKADATLWLNLGDSYSGHNLPGWRDGNEKKNGGVSNKNGVGYVDGTKPKDLIGIPWLVAFALRADGWYLRSDIIWHKPNPMPESVTDRPTKAHEYLFLMSKSERYHFDADAIAEQVTESSMDRLSQVGSVRANGGAKTNGTMKAVARANGEGYYRSNGIAGGRGVGTPTLYRNRRSVWTVTTQPYSGAHFATFPPKLIEPCIRAGCPDGGTVLDPFFGAGTTGVVCRQQHVRCIGIELNPAYAEIAKNRLSQGVLFGSSNGADCPATVFGGGEVAHGARRAIGFKEGK